MKSILTRLLVPAVLSTLAPFAHCGPLQQASVNQIVNDVKVIDPAKGARPAVVQDIIRDDLAVRTGIQSRTELLFQDDTLTRLGAETVFSFKAGTRDLNLDRGTMLLQVPKNHGGARIRTASVTASITGTTIMMEYLPSKSLKVVVLEGSLRLSPNGRFGEAVNLTAGRMVIMDPNAKRIPEPVKVDLRKLVNTSALINPVAFKGNSKARPAALPSIALIEKEIAIQDKLVKGNDLVGTNLVIAGSGTEVVLASEENLAQLDKGLIFDKGSVSTANGQIEAPTSTRLATAVTAPAAVGKDTILPTPADGVNLTDGSQAPSAVLPTGAEPSATTDPLANTNIIVKIAGGAITGTGTGAGTTGTGTLAIPSSQTNAGAGTGTGSGTGTPSPAFIAVRNPYVIDSSTTIHSGTRKITTNGVADAGGLFLSVAATGSPSAYLFDTPSAFDTASGIDSKFGAVSGGSAPADGVAVYRFTALDIQKAPTIFTSGGPADFALVSQSGITSGNSGSSWDLDSVRSIFFGTVNGPILMGKEFKTNLPASGFKYLQIYARGSTGVVTLDSKISLPAANLYVDAQQGINVTSRGQITAFNTEFKTPGTIAFDASPASATLKLNAGTSIQFTQPLTNSSVEMTAPLLRTTSDLSALGGFLKIGVGGIHASGSKLSGFNNIDDAGDLITDSVTVSDALNVGGTYQTGASNGAAALSASTMTIGGGVDLTGAAGGKGGSLTVNGADVNVSSTGINGIKAGGSDGLLALVGGGDGGTVNIGTAAKPVTNSITVDRPISATTGANGTGILTGGNGGTVSLVANGTIAVNSTVKVSDSALLRAARKGGNITLSSLKTSGTAISIGNTGQLLSLLNAAAMGSGGKIEFISAGGDILVNGGTAQADKGSVNVRNNGVGNVALNNANLRGDVVKVGALGANGQLIIGTGTINADTTLNLYGGTSNGQVRFTGDTTLSGAATKNIAGKTVTIDNGRTVTIGGRAARVFTDNANYSGSGGNSSTTGTFGGSGATTQPFSGRPNF